MFRVPRHVGKQGVGRPSRAVSGQFIIFYLQRQNLFPLKDTLQGHLSNYRCKKGTLEGRARKISPSIGHLEGCLPVFSPPGGCCGGLDATQFAHGNQAHFFEHGAGGTGLCAKFCAHHYMSLSIF